MKRIIQIDEQELDVLLNRAFCNGVYAQKKYDFPVPGIADHTTFKLARDTSREELKKVHFEKG